MNVAWHLQGLGLNPTMVSRVGSDALGDRARSALQSAGINVDDIQSDEKFPTGTVQVKLKQGSPSFDIVNDVAYDHIALPAAETLQQPYRLLYHGSLALRAPESRQTLQQIRAQLTCPVFVDVNLRAPLGKILRLADD